MRIRSFYAATCISVLSLASISAQAIQCSGKPASLASTIQTEQIEESKEFSCLLDGEEAIHLSGKLASSLVFAQGFVEVRFVDFKEKLLWTARRGPWIGVFSDFDLNESFPVPHGAARAYVIAKIEKGRKPRKNALGKWQIIAPRLSPGVLIVEEATGNAVITASKRAYWRFSTVPSDARGEFRMELRNPSGQTAAERIVKKTEAQTEIDFGKLPVGYYQLHTRFIPEKGHDDVWKNSLAVLPDGEPPNEPRFGIDGALSWFGGSSDMIKRSASLMRLAGVGSLRDRISWTQVQTTRDRINWGRYEVNAQIIAQAGMEQVQVFHDSPVWTRPSDHVQQASYMVPLDNSAVFEFGRAYAQGLGKTVRSIEYWNEQNAFFFAGHPFQYINGLKAFYAGIKSVDPNIRVLIGANAGKPGQFFEEIYRNNVKDFFDVRNLHFYGYQHYGKLDLDAFLEQNVVALEREGGIDKKPGWITETGYSLHRDKNGDWQAAEREQAEYLVKIFASGFAAGYERVFFFIWGELVEGNAFTWGIMRADLSPRPAYLALALLTRHLAGASVVASERHDAGRTVYFQQNDGGLIAVTWGGGAPINRLGTNVEIRDIFGQQLSIDSAGVNSSSPLLLSRIDKLPVQAQQVNLPKQGLLDSRHLRLEAKLQVNGKSRVSLLGDQVAVVIFDGETIEVSARVHSTGSETSGTTVDCIPGPGLEALPPVQISLDRPNSDDEPVACRFLARLSKVGRSYVSVQARNSKANDVVRIALIPDAVSATKRTKAYPLMPNGVCPRWVPYQSPNLALAIQTTGDATSSCAVNVTSRVNQKGDTQVFPAISIPANELVGAVALRLRVKSIPEYQFPPKALKLQLVEKNGRVWIVNLQRQKVNTWMQYFGLFNLAYDTPWTHSTNERLELSNVQEIMVGWGEYVGNPGQQHGFTIEAIDVLW
jgi:hypothetical protein